MSTSFTTHHHTYGSAVQQFGMLYVPQHTQHTHASRQAPFPVVILIHGGFWRNAYNLSLMTGLAEFFIQQEIAVWNIEYRRVGDEGGGWPGTFQDVARAADELRALAPTYNLDLQRVLAIGHSAGGQLAFWLGSRSHLPPTSSLATSQPLALKGVISQAGVLDLELAYELRLGGGAVAELLGGGPAEVPEHYALADPAALLPLHISQVLVHATADDRVPLEVSQTYTRKATRSGDTPTLIELPNANHFVLINPNTDEWNRTFEEVQKLLSL